MSDLQPIWVKWITDVFNDKMTREDWLYAEELANQLFAQMQQKNVTYITECINKTYA